MNLSNSSSKVRLDTEDGVPSISRSTYASSIVSLVQQRARKEEERTSLASSGGLRGSDGLRGESDCFGRGVAGRLESLGDESGDTVESRLVSSEDEEERMRRTLRC